MSIAFNDSHWGPHANNMTIRFTILVQPVANVYPFLNDNIKISVYLFIGH